MPGATPGPDPKPSLIERITRIFDPATLREAARAPGRTRLTRFFMQQLRVFVFTARSIVREEVALRAAALTYNTVLSIVPLLAVGFALFKAFGGLRRLEGPLRQVVMENLAVGRAEEVGAWLDNVISNVSAGAIAGVGVILLFYSAIGLLINIESSINRIWGCQRSRPLFLRFAVYWCLITLAPPLLGFSISISTRLQSSDFAMVVLNWLPFGLGRALLAISSAAGVCIAFTLVIILVPVTKVRFKPAVLGGAVSGVLWSISKYIFFVVSAGTLKYSAVYGALGVVPLLMIWIYASWIIVLFGATYAHANQAVHAEAEMEVPRVAPAQREMLGLRVAVAIATAFRTGQPPSTADAVADGLGAPPALVREICAALCAHGILLEHGGESGDAGFVPARDLQEISAAEVLEVLHQHDGAALKLAEGGAPVSSLLEQADRATAEVLKGTDLRALSLQAGGSELEAAKLGD
jgi:membrane protein